MISIRLYSSFFSVGLLLLGKRSEVWKTAMFIGNSSMVIDSDWTGGKNVGWSVDYFASKRIFQVHLKSFSLAFWAGLFDKTGIACCQISKRTIQYALKLNGFDLKKNKQTIVQFILKNEISIYGKYLFVYLSTWT